MNEIKEIKKILDSSNGQEYKFLPPVEHQVLLALEKNIMFSSQKII